MKAKPDINVTPLIDVLLVLLIIFMVITPIKPTDFKAKIPHKTNQLGELNPLSLIVVLNSDSTIRLNKIEKIATVEDSEKLINTLSQAFKDRKKNGVYSENLANRDDLTTDEKIEKTVFIKAPRSIDYGSVAKVIDAVKQSGAEPIGLQIDDLEN